MLAKRVIPTLLVRGRTLVKGQQFNAWRSVGLAAQAVRIHQARGVDEIVLLDIAAMAEGRGPDLGLVRELSDVLFCPLTVGGGVRSIDDAGALFKAGADKVSVCSGGEDGPVRLMQEIMARCGSQAVVASVDHLNGRAAWKRGKVWSQQDVAGWAKLCQQFGAGEILLTSIEHEGTMLGYDIDTIKTVAKGLTIPLIAHGGCGTYEHMREAIEAGASAVAAGAMFQFTDATPRGAAEYLASHGIEARV